MVVCPGNEVVRRGSQVVGSGYKVVGPKNSLKLHRKKHVETQT